MSSQGPRACFNCGNTGHLAAACPEPRKERTSSNGGGRGRGGSGGFSASSGAASSGNNSNSNSNRAPMRCFSCGGPHRAANCPTATSGPRCFNCSGYGHVSSACPKEQGVCFNCQKTGHKQQDCPEPRAPKKCFKCQGDHLARDCTA